MLPFDVWKSAFFGAFEVRYRKKIDFVFSLLPQLYIVCMVGPGEVLNLKFKISDLAM